MNGTVELQWNYYKPLLALCILWRVIWVYKSAYQYKFRDVTLYVAVWLLNGARLRGYR